MKMHPFLKSLGVLIVFAIIMFLAREEILTQSSFDWVHGIDIDSTKIFKKIICNISLSSMISLSFTLPFLFFNKNRFWQFVKWTFCLSLFIWVILITIASDLTSDVHIFTFFKQIIPFFESQMVLFGFFFPLGMFLITRIFLNVTLKLFLLLLLVFPIGIGIDSFNLFKILFTISSNSDFNLFFSIIFFLNFISNFYFRNLNFQEPVLVENNILDAPDI